MLSGMRSEDTRLRALAVALVTGLATYAVLAGERVPGAGPRKVVDRTRVSTRTAEVVFLSPTGELLIKQSERTRTLHLSTVLDGRVHAIGFPRSLLKRDGDQLVGEVKLAGEGEDVLARFALKPDVPSDSVEISARVDARKPHTFRLRADWIEQGAVFVSGSGVLVDAGSAQGRIAILEHGDHPLAFTSREGEVDVTLERPEGAPDPRSDDAATADGGAPGVGRAQGHHASLVSPEIVLNRVEATDPHEDLARAPRNRTGLVIAIGGSATKVWGQAFLAIGQKTEGVGARVTGTHGPTLVYGLDLEGKPRVRVPVVPDTRVQVDVPISVVSWYAALGSSETSAPVRFVPGTRHDLKLDVAPGGELKVHVVDGDTKQPLVARVIVHGVEGTLDPTFGPDYRASGAGPLVDVLHGEFVTPLPQGRYRIAATHGLEWSIDAETIEILPGRSRSVELALRRVVPTPGLVGCDLHVHARPSFDTPVSQEDRVLSLVSAGIEFAVPTEHNIVGDYTPSLSVLGLGTTLFSVPGVEITTYNPRLGHFGLFPYPTTGGLPPYRNTTVGAIFKHARQGGQTRVLQVNHPRLPKGIGYFQLHGFDPKATSRPSMRTEFDAVEVYNGYDLGDRGRVEAVMRDWFALLNLGYRFAATGSSDSHRIQYQWAGYPRTLAIVDPAQGGDGTSAVDTQAVVLAIKRGRSLVTTGPIVELQVDKKGPGEEHTGPLPEVAHVRVLAAPWVDVTRLEIVADGAVVAEQAIPSQPLTIGDEKGTLDEAAARAVRYEGEIKLALPPKTKWIVAVARGERKLDDILPFMPIQPLGFTNPVWLKP